MGTVIFLVCKQTYLVCVGEEIAIPGLSADCRVAYICFRVYIQYVCACLS